MRIGDLNPAKVEPAAGQTAEKLLKEAGQHPIAASDDAVELSRLSEAVAEPGPNQARLEQLRIEVQAGAYQVPAGDLAKKIVEFHEE